jgi:transcriptional regulator with XRE-family HTH domain
MPRLRNPATLGRALQRWRAREQLTQEEVSKRTGVPQAQVSRILNGRFRRRSQHLTTLCQAANIDPEESVRPEHLRVKLQDRLDALWDGSHEEADRLLKLLDAVEHIRGARDRRVKRQGTRKP